MNNDITKLLGIKDADIRVLSIKETTTTRTIALEKENLYPLLSRLWLQDVLKGHLQAKNQSPNNARWPAADPGNSSKKMAMH